MLGGVLTVTLGVAIHAGMVRWRQRRAERLRVAPDPFIEDAEPRPEPPRSPSGPTAAPEPPPAERDEETPADGGAALADETEPPAGDGAPTGKRKKKTGRKKTTRKKTTGKKTSRKRSPRKRGDDASGEES